MHAKNMNRPAIALPLSADATKPSQGAGDKSPAKGLSAALGAALGGPGEKAQFSGRKTGAPHHPDTLSKAQKPVGGANRTQSPRKGHR